MLPKENRLKKKKDFANVLRKGRGFREGFLFLKLAGNSLEESRFGFVVSQRISKKAVIRNRLKRRLGEIIRLNLSEIKKGVDGVFIPGPGLRDKTFQELGEIMVKLLKKAKIL